MRTDRKERQRALSEDLQKSVSVEALAIKELTGLMLEEAKDSLITARGEDVYRAQGEASALQRLLTMLTRPTPQMAPRQE